MQTCPIFAGPITDMTRPVIVDHLSSTNAYFFFCSIVCNLITIYTITTKSSSLLHIIIGILLQLAELGYCTLNGRDISKNISQYNMCSQGQLLQGWSKITNA